MERASVLQRIALVTGDITRLPASLGVDTIVDAANNHLLGGGGVDGAIHHAAGPRLLEHNRTLGGCETGQAKWAPGFDLEAAGVKHIVLTVGPIWRTADPAENIPLGERDEDGLLAACYENSLALAAELGSRVTAFPSISTGVYGFPRGRAARIALRCVMAWLVSHDRPGRVVLCGYGPGDTEPYRAIMDSTG